MGFTHSPMIPRSYDTKIKGMDLHGLDLMIREELCNLGFQQKGEVKKSLFPAKTDHSKTSTSPQKI